MRYLKLLYYLIQLLQYNACLISGISLGSSTNEFRELSQVILFSNSGRFSINFKKINKVKYILEVVYGVLGK